MLQTERSQDPTAVVSGVYSDPNGIEYQRQNNNVSGEQRAACA
jgi:hypothetical protein